MVCGKGSVRQDPDGAELYIAVCGNGGIYSMIVRMRNAEGLYHPPPSCFREGAIKEGYLSFAVILIHISGNIALRCVCIPRCIWRSRAC